MNTVATIVPINTGKFRAKILFPEAVIPVEFFRQTDSIDELYKWLLVEYSDVDIVSRNEFNEELDHIRLFNARSIDQHAVINTNDRLTDVDIINLLDETDNLIEELENRFNAICNPPNMENKPRQPE